MLLKAEKCSHETSPGLRSGFPDRVPACGLSRSVESDSSVTPWAVAHQAPPSMGFSRQEYWSGLPLPSPEELPNPGIKCWSPALQAVSLPFELQGSPVWAASAQ